MIPTLKTQHERDLELPCPHRDCRVPAGQECVHLSDHPAGTVHFGRRIKRLLRDGRPS